MRMTQTRFDHDIRSLTAGEILQVSGGNHLSREAGGNDSTGHEPGGELPTTTVTAHYEGSGGLMPAGYIGDALKFGGGAAWGWWQANQAAAHANEKDISDKFISPTSGIGVAPGEDGNREVVLNSRGEFAKSYLLNNGFYGVDRDGNKAIDFIISPPWTNTPQQVMVYERGTWSFNW